MLDRLHVSYRMEIDTVTPLHIGSGTALTSGYDLVGPPGSRYTYRVNETALLEAKLAAYEAAGDQAATNGLLAGASPADLLTAADYQAHPEFFWYRLRGTPPPDNAAVKEHIRGALTGVYLPGSSLKGALRTALLWRGFAATGSRPNLRGLDYSRTYVARKFERATFGLDPNHDWLRTLQVGDAALDRAQAGEPLALRQASVFRSYPSQRRDVSIWLEAVATGARFAGNLAIDTYGLDDKAAREALGWHQRQRWYDDLLPAARDYAASRIASELAYFGGHGPRALAQEYARLQQICQQLGQDECLLRVGFGGGWESKTLGYGFIHQSDDGFESLVRNYQMSRNHPRRAGDPYPLTRTLLREGNAFVAPLGWIRLRLAGYGEGEQEGQTDQDPEEIDAPPEIPPQVLAGIPELERAETIYVGVVLRGVNRQQRVGTVRVDGRLDAAGAVVNTGYVGREASLRRTALVRPLSALAAGARVRFLLTRSASDNLMAEEVRLDDRQP